MFGVKPGRPMPALVIALAVGGLVAPVLQPPGRSAQPPAPIADHDSPEVRLAQVAPLPGAGNQERIAFGAPGPGSGSDAPSLGREDAETVLGGYRTVEASYALLDAWSAAYPTLAEPFTYGVSWDKQTPGGPAGYDLRGITVTNRLRDGLKPTLALLAAVHARELVTTEIALRYVEHLLSAYGRDPDVTWLLDEHQIVVFPLVNPDGRKDAERGILQRKNRDTINGPCPTDPPTGSSQPGVDLNRNFTFEWDRLNAPGIDPCLVTFPGPFGGSEPEVAALESWLAGVFPTRRGTGDHDPAPVDVAGIVISLHAPGNWVLWPWGYTTDPTPNAADLAGLGRKLATYNGYAPHQITDLFIGSGSTDDWVYGTLGIPIYTFEIGPPGGPCGGFSPPYPCLDGGEDGGFWPLNRPALLYAAKVARAPYLLHRGPDALTVMIEPTAGGYAVQATIDDTQNGNQAIRAAELYLDAPPWRGGTAVPLAAADGTFSSPIEVVQGTLAGPIPTGQRLVFVRGRDAHGQWGPVTAAWLPVPAVHLPVVGRRP